MENIELVLSCFNQHNFKIAKDNIDTITSAIRRSTPGGYQGNHLMFDLLGVIKNYSFEEIDYPLFQEVLSRNGKTPAETQAILGMILKWKQFTKEQTAPTRKMINDLCCSTIIGRANELFAQDPQGYMNYIKNSNIKTSDSDWLVPQNFGNFDINSIIADSSSRLYHTSMKYLDASFQPQGAVPGGSIVVLSTMAGVGKSLNAMETALELANSNGGLGGVPVLYFCLGDMGPIDFVTRLNTYITGGKFSESYMDLKGAYERVKQATNGNLDIVFAPAGKISASEIVDYVKANPKFEVIIIDYDSQLKPETISVSGGKADSGLYQQAGDSYNAFTELTGMGKLVLILSQPKSFGNMEDTSSYDYSALGDSRKKFEVADAIVTIGKVRDHHYNMGIIRVCKNRRGKLFRGAYIRIEAQFKLIPIGVYDYLRNLPQDTPEPTIPEIDRMIQAYEQQYSNIQSNVQQQLGMQPQQQPIPMSTGNGGGKGKSPFK